MTLQAVEELITRGERALALGQADVALNAGDRALLEIGDRYADPMTLDDTGMKLVLADSQAKKGETLSAATMKLKIARERLQLANAKASGDNR